MESTAGAASARRQRLVLLLVLCILGGLLTSAMALPLVGSSGLAARTLAQSFNKLPSDLAAGPLAQRSVVVANDGTPIASLVGNEDRRLVSLSAVPVALQRAVIAIEDSRFYSHHGVDFRGLFRALVTNSRAGGVRQGGSTLTQQYVKNVLLERASTSKDKTAAVEQSTKRKLREARYALALEQQLSKREILERYLNIAYFGHGAYGVGTAAEVYFGKPVQELSLPESAMLAGIVKSPSQFDPTLHPQAAKTRRDTVLYRMAELRLVDAKAAKAAVASPVRLHQVHRVVDACEGTTAPFFCDYIRRQLTADRQVGSDRLGRGGLTIHTTLDPRIQAIAQEVVDSTVGPANRAAAVVVVLKPGTGDVLAMAVNRRYGSPTKDSTATKVPLATKPFAQPGSTFKMFTLATAIEQGIPLSTKIHAPACYVSDIYPLDRGDGSKCAKGFSNAGDSEAGTFDLYSGTWDSVNTFYIQLEERVGQPNVQQMAERLGVPSSRFAGIYPSDGSLTIGGKITVSAMDMATAYAAIAARGLRCDPRGVSSITDSLNHPLPFTQAAACQQALDPGVADTVTSVLQGVVERGTGYPNAVIGRPAAGKTGTTDNFAAAWFDGYVPSLAAAVELADPRGSQYVLASADNPLQADGRSWDHMFGGDVPALMWGRILRAALVGTPVQSFTSPDSSFVQGKTTEVPDVTGLSVSAATTTLSDAGFSVVVAPKLIAAAPLAYGLVAKTDPPGGSSAPAGTTITLVLSNGQEPVPTTDPSPSPTQPPPGKKPTPSPGPTTVPPSPGPTHHPKPKPSGT